MSLPYHALKIEPKHFDALASGEKTAELRKHDREFQVGDLLILMEWDGEKHTGRHAERFITHILRAVEGLAPGYCILSMRAEADL